MKQLILVALLTLTSMGLYASTQQESLAFCASELTKKAAIVGYTGPVVVGTYPYEPATLQLRALPSVEVVLSVSKPGSVPAYITVAPLGGTFLAKIESLSLDPNVPFRTVGNTALTSLKYDMFQKRSEEEINAITIEIQHLSLSKDPTSRAIVASSRPGQGKLINLDEPMISWDLKPEDWTTVFNAQISVTFV